MKIINNTQNVRIPCWSLNFLINQDATGLTDEEMSTIKTWIIEFTKVCTTHNQRMTGVNFIVSTVDSEEYYTKYPEFGVPCICQDCDVVIGY